MDAIKTKPLFHIQPSWLIPNLDKDISVIFNCLLCREYSNRMENINMEIYKCILLSSLILFIQWLYIIIY